MIIWTMTHISLVLLITFYLGFTMPLSICRQSPLILLHGFINMERFWLPQKSHHHTVLMSHLNSTSPELTRQYSSHALLKLKEISNQRISKHSVLCFNENWHTQIVPENPGSKTFSPGGFVCNGRTQEKCRAGKDILPWFLLSCKSWFFTPFTSNMNHSEGHWVEQMNEG